MTDFLSLLLDVSVLVFAVASMLSVGFSYTVREILSPLRNIRAVIRTLVANFILVPLLAYLILQLMSLERPLAIGLFLVASAAGAPFLIKLTAVADQNVAISAALLVLLLPATILYMPIVLPIVLPNADISAFSIAMPLVLSMLLPLAVGLIIRARSKRWAQRMLPFMGSVSTIALIVLIVTTFAVNFQGILRILGEGAIVAVLLLIGGAFVLGYLVGGYSPESREELALATAQRNIAAATVVATQTVEFPGTLIVVVISSLVGLAILFPIAFSMARRAAKRVEAGARPKKREPERDTDHR